MSERYGYTLSHDDDTPDPARELAEKMAGDLFMNGSKRQAHRLVLLDNIEGDLGGWCRQAVVDRLEARLRAFLVQRDGQVAALQGPLALVQEAARAECEFGTPCCEESEVSAVCWPCRSREALAAAPAQRDAEKAGELAALRQALEDVLEREFPLTCEHGTVAGDHCWDCLRVAVRTDQEAEEAEERLLAIPYYAAAKAALAPGAGEREAEVLAAAAVLRRTPRMAVDNEGDRILNPEYTVAEEHFNQAVDAIRDARKETP